MMQSSYPLSKAQRKEEGDIEEDDDDGNVVEAWGLGVETLPFCCGVCQVTSTEDLQKLYTKHGAKALEDLCEFVETDLGVQAAMVFTFSNEEFRGQRSLFEALMDIPGATVGKFPRGHYGRNLTMVTVPLYPIL